MGRENLRPYGIVSYNSKLIITIIIINILKSAFFDKATQSIKQP